jgi:hypothetical protein
MVSLIWNGRYIGAATIGLMYMLHCWHSTCVQVNV